MGWRWGYRNESPQQRSPDHHNSPTLVWIKIKSFDCKTNPFAVEQLKEKRASGPPTSVFPPSRASSRHPRRSGRASSTRRVLVECALLVTFSLDTAQSITRIVRRASESGPFETLDTGCMASTRFDDTCGCVREKSVSHLLLLRGYRLALSYPTTLALVKVTFLNASVFLVRIGITANRRHFFTGSLKISR